MGQPFLQPNRNTNTKSRRRGRRDGGRTDLSQDELSVHLGYHVGSLERMTLEFPSIFGLETADVIAQVDRKFILAKVRTAPITRNLEGPSNDGNLRCIK
jgi:hypothetical protein